MSNLRVRTAGGEGKTAKAALKGLCSSLKDEEVDEDKVLVIHLTRGRVESLGNSKAYDGFVARVVSYKPENLAKATSQEEISSAQ